MFLEEGVTMACLNESGKVPSEMARLMIVVMGNTKELRQDLSRKVGIMSREHVALEEATMAFLTSWIVAGKRKGRKEG